MDEMQYLISFLLLRVENRLIHYGYLSSTYKCNFLGADNKQ